MDEYGPSILIVRCDPSEEEACGVVAARYMPAGLASGTDAYPEFDTLPAVLAERRVNRCEHSLCRPV